MDNSLLGVPGRRSDNILLLRQTEEYATTSGFPEVKDLGQTKTGLTPVFVCPGVDWRN